MPKTGKKGKKTKNFFKIKERLVLPPPKKLLGRKLVGVVFLVAGTIILAFSTVYFYLIPQFFPKEKEIVLISEDKQEFLPERILVPGVGLNLLIKSNSFEGEIPLSVSKMAKGEQLFVLGKGGTYQTYLVLSTEVSTKEQETHFLLKDRSLKVVLPLSDKTSKNFIINLQQVD